MLWIVQSPVARLLTGILLTWLYAYSHALAFFHRCHLDVFGQGPEQSEKFNEKALSCGLHNAVIISGQGQLCKLDGFSCAASAGIS